MRQLMTMVDLAQRNLWLSILSLVMVPKVGKQLAS